MMRTVTLLLCIVGLFVHYHKSQNRIRTRCDVGLHGRKYDGPTTKSILFIYVRTHRVTFCEKASLRQLALVLLSGDVALNPGPLKFGFANCRSIRNKTTAAVCISRRVPQGKKYYIEIFPLCIGHCCTILQVENSLETALSVMLFEILTLFHFQQKSKMAAESGEK